MEKHGLVGKIIYFKEETKGLVWRHSASETVFPHRNVKAKRGFFKVDSVVDKETYSFVGGRNVDPFLYIQDISRFISDNPEIVRMGIYAANDGTRFLSAETYNGIRYAIVDDNGIKLTEFIPDAKLISKKYENEINSFHDNYFGSCFRTSYDYRLSTALNASENIQASMFPVEIVAQSHKLFIPSKGDFPIDAMIPVAVDPLFFNNIDGEMILSYNIKVIEYWKDVMKRLDIATAHRIWRFIRKHPSASAIMSR